MRAETIADFLDQLAARLPTPGGGATAALDAAQAAALVAMVARYSQGPDLERIVAQADGVHEPAEVADAVQLGVFPRHREHRCPIDRN